MLNGLKPLIKLMRPDQYVKGVAIIVGAAASGLLLESDNLINLAKAFISFSLCSSAVYILNDLQDVSIDKLHPKKKFRPLASGEVSKMSAYFLWCLLVVLSFLLTFSLGNEIRICLATYLTINVCYSYFAKNLVVLELLIVASGFVLRGLVGVFAVGADPSMWFNLLAMFASLLLVSGKRLAEKKNVAIEVGGSRSTVKLYSSEFLTSLRTVSISGLLMSYFLMVESKIQGVDSSTYAILLQSSLLPYIFCVLYLGFLLSNSDFEEPHTLILKYRPLLLGALIWATIYGLALYGVQQ